QHSNEDNFALLSLAKTYMGTSRLFVSGRPHGRGDKILMHEDKNPNTRGVLDLVGQNGARSFDELLAAIDSGQVTHVLALGDDCPAPAEKAGPVLAKLTAFVVLATHEGPLARAAHVVLPACVWAEAEGTYVNAKGMAQRSDRALDARGDARPGWAL